MKTIWQAFEGNAGTSTLAPIWQEWVSHDFGFIKDAFISAEREPATAYPCPQDCGC